MSTLSEQREDAMELVEQRENCGNGNHERNRDVGYPSGLGDVHEGDGARQIWMCKHCRCLFVERS